MAKKKNVECDAPVIRYEADPESFKTIVLKVHKKLPSGDDIYADAAPISAGEKDAMIMSQEFPEDAFVTVYAGEPPKINQSITLTKRFVIHAFIIMQPRAVWLDSGTGVVPGSHLPL